MIYQPENSSAAKLQLRLSDTDRVDAFSRLTFAYGEGRLDLAEYDRRCDAVTEATTHGDLIPLFRDLPGKNTSVEPAVQSKNMQLYTREEIEQSRTSGQRTRLGIFSLGSVGTVALTAVAGQAGFPGIGALIFTLIPILFILLYVMKVGPDSWYTPSPRQLERERLREIQAERRMEEERRKALRAAKRDEITGSAMDLAQKTLDRYRMTRMSDE